MISETRIPASYIDTEDIKDELRKQYKGKSLTEEQRIRLKKLLDNYGIPYEEFKDEITRSF